MRAQKPGSDDVPVNPRINHLLLANALLGTFLSGIGTRIYLVAMPTVAKSLDTDVVGASWGVIGYMLSSIGLSLVFGRIGDLYGRARVYGTGYAVMMVSSLLCGLATTISEMILFRVVQGAGAAMTISVGRAIAAEAMPPEMGGKAQGFMSAAHHAGFLLGPSLGGFVIDYLGWRWGFFALVPLCAIGIALVRRGGSWSGRAKAAAPVDYPGAGLFLLSSTALIVFVDRGSRELMAGIAGGLFLASLFLSSLTLFLWRESRAASPIMNLALFRIRMFALSFASLLVVAIVYSIMHLILPFYLQEILQLSPSFMGALLMLAPVFTVSLAPVSGLLADRVGAAVPATLGVALLTASVLLAAFLTVESHWLAAAAVIAVSGLANGFFNPANGAAMVGSVPKEHMGVASATYSVTFNLGLTLGTSLGTFLLTLGFQDYTGDPRAILTVAEPEAFTSASRFAFSVAAAIAAAALLICMGKMKENVKVGTKR
jgi:EmrB/QacA subfamily drug resistance transporter